MPLVAAIDVGTGSARAGIFDAAGRLLARAEQPIDTLAPAAGPRRAGLRPRSGRPPAPRSAPPAPRPPPAPTAIAGLAFDATCSLVLRDAAGRPVTASTTGDDRRDTILWLDHRAIPEAEAITATGPPVLALSGGAVSPEMQLPKLLWLKRHLPATWARLGQRLRPRRLPLLARHRQPGPLALHPRLQVELPARRDPGLAARLPRAASASPTCSPAPASPPPPPPSPPTSARSPPRPPPTSASRPRPASPPGLIDAHAGALGVLGHLAGAARPRRATPR